MKEFRKLLARKDQALSIFTKTKASLERLISDINAECEKSEKTIGEEKAKLAFLEGEHAACCLTVENITKVLGQ